MRVVREYDVIVPAPGTQAWKDMLLVLHDNFDSDEVAAMLKDPDHVVEALAVWLTELADGGNFNLGPSGQVLMPGFGAENVGSTVYDPAYYDWSLFERECTVCGHSPDGPDDLLFGSDGHDICKSCRAATTNND